MSGSGVYTVLCQTRRPFCLTYWRVSEWFGSLHCSVSDSETILFNLLESERVVRGFTPFCVRLGDHFV